MKAEKRAARNRTLTLSTSEKNIYQKRLLDVSSAIEVEQLRNKTASNDLLKIIEYLPRSFIDLMIIDPPYNLNKKFNGISFKKGSIEWYSIYIESWLPKLLPLLKPNASVYICGDWHSSTSIHLIAEKYLRIHSRITWEREKGRGAKKNWKNCTEDIWFCSKGTDYTFNMNAVKLKRKVMAPYKVNGKPKDWEETEAGNFRLTHPSNLWHDITVPYWSMPENTDHPTQKPEKLIAKLILASSNPGDMVFDPFLGAGTTSVVAKKLGRNFFGTELDREYCLLTEKRLALAEQECEIQGYSGGIFWERNTLNLQKSNKMKMKMHKSVAPGEI